jgi:GNAT superfamily N-acetyltransferase
MELTPTTETPRAPPLEMRAVRFEDVPDILRLVAGAVALDCRDHYDSAQRAAVYGSYAGALFLDVLGPFETIAAEQDGQLIGFAQLDSTSNRLRALFVDGRCQKRGLGRALLAEVEARARARGCARLHGAMSLNAVPFYERCGFHRIDGDERLMTLGVSVPVARMEKQLRSKPTA